MEIFLPLLFKSVNYSSSLCVQFMQILFCKGQTVLDYKSLEVFFFDCAIKKEHFIIRMTKMALASGWNAV